MTALPVVDPIEVELALIGIYQAASSTGRTPLEVVRDRKGHVVVMHRLTDDPEGRENYTHHLAVLNAAEKQLIKE